MLLLLLLLLLLKSCFCKNWEYFGLYYTYTNTKILLFLENFREPEPAQDLLSPPLPDTLQAVAEPKQRCVQPTSGNLKLLFNVVFCTFHTKHRIK